MEHTTVVVGSLGAARDVLRAREVIVAANADVVVVPTAAAFTGAAPSAVSAAESLGDLDVRIEAVMVTDRAGAGDPYVAQRIVTADVVVLTDGSALHARSVWRDTPVGTAIDGAALVIAVGSVASVLGDVMVDPRGGAPTTGLGYRRGPVFCAAASGEQLARTRALLGDSAVLVVLGPAGAVVGVDGLWRVVRDDVVVTRGEAPATL